jgi:hypothetical protein
MQPRQRDDPRKQIAKMRQLFPQFKYKVTAASGVIWRGWLQPQETSQSYQIRIQHTPGSAPRVYVDSPPLAEGVHHLNSDGSLCLYWPKEWRWTPQTVMAETILVWAAMWLFYYELWLEIGEWLGPEAPGSKQEPRRRREQVQGARPASGDS